MEEVEMKKTVLDQGLSSSRRKCACSNTAFTRAIRDEDFEKLKSLLGSVNAETSCALFHAIKFNCIAAVKLICEHLQSSEFSLKTKLNEFADDEHYEFPRFTTPLLYAANQNQVDLVKMFLDFGAEFPSVDVMVSRSGPHHYDRALARLHYNKAITSEAYLLTTPDPIETAFEVAKKIKDVKDKRNSSMIQEYKNIESNLDTFLSTLLMKVTSIEEIRLLVGGGGFFEKRGTFLDTEEDVSLINTARSADLDSRSTIPKRMHVAMEFGYKQFLVNSNCQRYILERWYYGQQDWLNMSPILFGFWSLLIVVLSPIISLLYILLPSDYIHYTIRAPYVRFLLNFASRATFILLLLEYTVNLVITKESHTGYVLNVEQTYNDIDIQTSRVGVLTVMVYLIIIGMTWREIKELWRCPKTYLNLWLNWVDILQLIFYWTSIILNIAGFLSGEEGLNLDILSQQYITNLNAGHVGGNSTDYFDHGGDDHPEIIVDWQAFDLFLISETMFALGTVLTFLSLLHDAVILEFVGPLIVSFVGMAADIGRFLVIFACVWVSFGIGLTQLYQTFGQIEKSVCKDCDELPFSSYKGTMEILFTSLFGFTDYESLRHFDEHYQKLYWTETVGVVIYGAYMVIVVTVMMNALIAMMSNTYTKVEENSDVEWKFARTKLMAAHMPFAPTLGPPFNLVPSVKTIRRVLSCTFLRMRRLGNSDTTMYEVNTEDTKDAPDGGHEETDSENSRDEQERRYKGLINYVTECYIDELGCISDDKQDEPDRDEPDRGDPDTDQHESDELTKMKESIDLIRSELKEVRAETTEALKQIQENVQLILNCWRP